MKIIKKRFALILGMLLIMQFCLAACSKSDDNKESTSAGKAETSSPAKEVNGITKADFAGILGGRFGYNDYESKKDIFEDVSSSNENYSEIQALSEWGVIENGGKFEPDKDVSLKYAVESAVKAVGIDKIKKSGADINENDLTGFFTANIAKIDMSDPDQKIDRLTASQIVAYAARYSGETTLPQYMDMNLAEGVKTPDSGIILNADGYTGTFDEPDKYAVGDVIYLKATPTDVAKAIKIVEIKDNAFSYSQPKLEDVLQDLQLSGTYDCTVVETHSVSDGVSIKGGKALYNDILSYMNTTDEEYEMTLTKNPQVNFSHDDSSISCKASISGEYEYKDPTTKKTTKANANASLEIGIKNIKATVDYDYSWFRLHKADVTLTYDVYANAHVDGKISQNIPLGEVVFNIAGPLNLKAKLYATVGADGYIDVNYTLSTVATVGWHEGTGLSKSIDSQASSKLEAEATLTAEATLLLDLRLFDWSMANAQVTSGLGGYAKVDADLISGEGTFDVLLWVPLRWGVNQESCLITAINGDCKYEATIWDSSNSPFKWELHKEFGKDAEVKEITDEIKDEDGEVVDEMHIFDFEPINFDFIELPTYVLFLDEGDKKEIGISHIPEGYLASDIVFESADTSICEVDKNGIVTANKSGSTLIKVSTNDETTAVWVAVTVSEDLTVDFEELAA